MAHRILLISVNRCSLPYPVFPLGIAHLASALKISGYETKLYDMQVDSATDLAGVIDRFRPDYIGLSLRNIDDIYIETSKFFAPALYEAAKEIRDISDVPIIVGGSGYSLFPDKLLEMAKADFGVCGEGETSLPDLLDCLESGRNYENIPGLVFRKNASIIVNPRKPCSDKTISSPQRPKYLVDYYLENSSMLNIQTQRGCAYKCCYCTYPLIEGNTFRCRSPENVCDEIAEIKNSGASYFFFVDSVFNSSTEHVTGVCEEIIRRGLNIKWGCYLRPKGISQSLMDLMANAGLSHIEFGSDSLCDSVLYAYGKDFTFTDILHASECARKAKVHYAHFLIIGGPGETEATINKGFVNAKYIKRTVFFSVVGMRIYPGTPIYSFVIKDGTVSKNNDLLQPYFYFTPYVSKERIIEILTEYRNQFKNWIVGELSPELQKIKVKLHKKGVVGPLWEFLAQ